MLGIYGGEGESCNQTQGGGGDVTNFRLGDVARRGSSPAERGSHVTRHTEARSFVGPTPAAKGTPRARGMIGQIHVMSLHPDKSCVTLVWALLERETGFGRLQKPWALQQPESFRGWAQICGINFRTHFLRRNRFPIRF